MHPGKLVLGLVSVAAVGLAQIPGRNVNMVSGIGWPTGDPFLQRQNEPSIAVSTRNPLHLLAGANDYRTVDVPGIEGSKATGDAWLSIFKSRDGGLTWTSTLLPGYPQDRSVTGRNSVLFQKAYKAGADPVVRAGTNGMFYYAGLGFVRSNTGLDGATGIFLARFIDNNNTEGAYATYTKNGRVIPYTKDFDPIKYLDNRVVAEGIPAPTVSVSSGGPVVSTFLDKPWMTVDIPRAGALNCVVGGGDTPVQQFPGGNVYVVWTSFENGNDEKGAIMFSRSRDCGVTFSTPIQVASSATANQGATMAVDPATGALYLVWRRFATICNPHGMMMSRSTDFGVTFSPPQTIATAGTPAPGQVIYSPFDQGSTIVDTAGNVLDARFRTNGYPTMGVGADGRIYVAWSQRGAGPNGDARIVITSSMGGTSWTPPVAVDSSTSFRGHQVMPAMSLAEGKLTLVYYDLRDSNTKGIFTKLPVGGGYQETRQPIGDRQAGTDSRVFTDEISDTYLKADGTRAPLAIRQTMDVRVAQTNLASLALSFQAARVSDYAFGSRPPAAGQTATGPIPIEQMQLNPPNLPMFALGTTPFMGDYIDVTALQFIVGADGKWTYNLAPTPSPVFHAVWTDNRDVRPPADRNWRNYTPPNVALTLAAQLRGPGFPSNSAEGKADPAAPKVANSIAANSLVDPSLNRLACVAGQTGMRNQNIYTARITNGFVASAPTNSKPLNTTFARAFVVTGQNTTKQSKTYRLSIANQPPGGRASFSQTGRQGVTGDILRLDTRIPPNGTISRPVFILSSNPTATVRVDFTEITAPGGTVVAGGLRSTVVLNRDVTNPPLRNPDINNPDINNRELYNPDINNPDINNPDINNPDINNPDINNPDINNPDINNPDINNPDINNPDINNPDINNLRVANPDINNPDINNPDINNPDINNPDINNPDINNPDINNPDINNPDINNGTFQDVSWKVTNRGNTFASYSLKTLLTGAGIPEGFRKRLVVYKVYGTPVSDGCSLKYMAQNQILLYVNNPVFSAQSQIANPNLSDSSESNATVALGPGETARLLLRVLVPNTQPNFRVADVVAASTTAHAVNTTDVANNSTPKFAASKLFITNANPLPPTQVGATYRIQLENAGGMAPIAWSLVPQAGQQLPTGLSLTPLGVIEGQPTVAGTFNFTVLATDSDPGTVKQTALQTFTVVVAAPPPLTIVTPAALPFGFVGLPYSITLQSGGGVGAKTWSILPGSTLPASFVLNPTTGQLTGTIAANGVYTFTARVTDSSPVPMVATKLLTLQVSPITLVFSAQPANTPASQPFTVRVRAQDSGTNPLAGVTVNLSLREGSPSGAVLTGTTTAVTGTDGQATFANLRIALSADYQLTANANGANSATSRLFTIQPLPGFIQTIAGRTWTPPLAGGPAASYPLGHVNGLATDAAGNIYAADPGNHIVVRITPAGALTVVAGTGVRGFSGDGGPATNAMLANPARVAVHPSTGDIYVSDQSNVRIRKISGGVITTVAGTGTAGFTGDDGPAVEAQISTPLGIGVDASGNVYFGESARIRRIDPTGVITTFAGTGTSGFSGDGGAPTSAQLGFPSDVVVAGSTVYFADSNFLRVRRISGGVITTVAGNGTYGTTGDGGPATSASLAGTSGLALDAAGNLYISTEHTIRQVALGGTISIYAGTTPGFSGDSGLATAARFVLPAGMTTDAAGNLFIADSFNQRIRRVDAGSKIITTFAGNGQFKDGGDGGAATSAFLNFPFGVAVDSTGNVFIADRFNSRIRRRDTTGRITTFAGNGNPGGTGDGGPATSATLGDFMTDVAVDKANNVYVADSGFDGVRRITPAGVISRFYTSAISTLAFDNAGNAFLADARNHRILRIPAGGGAATVFAGGTGPGFSGDGGPATAAKLTSPQGLAIDGAGNVFIADTSNFRVRMVSPSGIISTYAGNGTAGATGDGGPATSAAIRAYGLALDARGNLYFGANTRTEPVRRVDTNGIITTIAGNGTAGFSGDGAPATAAQLTTPARVAVDAAGNLYISDAGNDRIRRVTLPPTPAGNPTQRLTITATTLPNAAYNTAYSTTLAAVGGSGTRTWSIASGTLPTGVTLNPTTGQIAGTPTSVGPNPITVQVTASGVSAQALLTLTVSAPVGSSLSFPAAVPPQTAGAVFSAPVTVLATGPGSVPLAGAVVTLAIGTNPIGGVLTGTLNRTTNASGIATFNDLAIDLGANGYTLRATSAGFAAPANSSIFDVALATGGISTVAGRSWQINPAPGTLATTVPISENRGLALAPNGDLIMTDTANSLLYRITPAGALSVIAGTGALGFGGDGGPALAASVISIRGPAVDAAGNIYFSDTNNRRIRRIAAATGIITTIAGTGTQGFSGDGGPATAAQVNFPAGIAIENLAGGQVNLYFADSGTQRIRRIDAAGIITTIAGTGTAAYNGDNILATAAQVAPRDVVFQGGALYFSDSNNHRIRKVTLGTGIITTVAGTGTFGYNGDGIAATSANLANPQAVSLDAAGNLYIADTSNHRVRRVDAVTGIITTIAGNGQNDFSGDGGSPLLAAIGFPSSVWTNATGTEIYIWDDSASRLRLIKAGVINTFAGNGQYKFSGDGGPATQAHLRQPGSMTIDSAGNWLIPDSGARVRKVTPAGTIATIAGTGRRAFAGNGGLATQASLSTFVDQVAVHPTTGDIYLSDTNNLRIRRIDSSGNITAFAGTGIGGFSGDGGPATAANFSLPRGMVFDASGNLYVADASNHRVRKIDPAGIVTTIAGTGVAGTAGDGGPASAAQLNLPNHLAFDTAGNMYIAESTNNCIRRINPAGIISTFAGLCGAANGFAGDGGPATGALFASPVGVATDTVGNVYVGDTFNHRVRRIDPAGIITTIAGTGTAGFAGDGGSATAAQFNGPRQLSVDNASGNLFVADSVNDRIRMIKLPSNAGVASRLSITTTSLPGASRFVSYNATVQATGGTLPYTWSATVSPAASAFSINPVTGVITGVLPHLAGTSTLNVTVTDAGGRSAQTTLTIDTNWADSFNFTVQPTDTVAGAAISPTVQVQSASIAGAQVTLTARAPGSATPSATATAIANGSGVASFPGFSISAPSYGYVLTAAVGPVSFNSNPFNVTVGFGSVMTVAGKNWAPVLSTVATNFPAGGSRFSVLDAAGNLYVADQGNHIIIRVTPLGAASVVAGVSGTLGFAGDGGPATSALLNNPLGLALDGAANLLYIADHDNGRIRRVNLNTGIITTFAGSGTFGSSSGDGGPAIAASFNGPLGLALSAGDLYVSEYSGHRIRRITLATTIVTTVAGTGVAGYSGDGVAATTVRLNFPHGIAVDGSGNLVIADSSNNRVRLVSGGIISTIAGTGSCGSAGDGASATAATLCTPFGVAFRGTELFISDASNNRIRRVSGGIITTAAGNGQFATASDGVTALAATFAFAQGITVSPAGDLFVHDGFSRRVMKVDAATQLVTNILGNGQFRNQSIGAGPATDLNSPFAITGDTSGNIYFTQVGNFSVQRLSPAGAVTPLAGNTRANSNSPDGAGNSVAAHNPRGIAVVGTDVYFTESGSRIRKVDGLTGFVTTYANASNLAGFADGPVATARFSSPYGMAYDASRQLLFVADAANNRIRQINMATAIVTTVAGTGSASFSGDDGPAIAATLNIPQGVTYDQNGNLYIADTNNCVIRMVNPSGIISTVAGTPGNCASGGDGGPATLGAINLPYGVAVDSLGNLFISEGGHRIRRVDILGRITTLSSPSGAGFSGDGGPLSAARFTTPRGIYLNSAGTLYIADSQNNRVRAAFGIGIMAGAGRLTLLSATLANATFNSAYAASAPVAGGTGSGRVFSITAGALPAGLTLNPTTGAITGTVTGGPGVYNFTLRVTETAPAQAATGSYTLTVVAGVGTALSFSAQPTTTVRNAVITPAPQVQFTPATAGVQVTLSLAFNPGGSTLAGTLTGVTDGTGRVSFNNVTLDKAADGYQLRATIPGLTTDSAAFNVTPAAGEVATVAGKDWAPPLSTPTAASYPFSIGRGVTFDAAGNMYAVDVKANIVVKVAPGGGLTTRIAGTGKNEASPDGGPANTSALLNPSGIALDASGNIHISESSRIRRVDAVTGIITSVAGTGVFGSSGDGGLATAAQVGCPNGLAFSGTTLYVADSCLHKVRRFTVGGNISTFAGSGVAGFSGDGGGAGTATSAQLNSPEGLAFDNDTGNLLIADTGNFRIRSVTSDQRIATFAGNGNCCNEGFGGPATSAALGPVHGVAFAGGAVFVSTDASIRRIQGGGIVRLAGNGVPGFTGDGGPATSARIMGGYGIALDGSSSVYFADAEAKRIRKIDSATDNISTYLGATPGLYGGDGGAATSANLFSPRGVTGDSSGNLYIAEDRGYRVRKVTAAGVISTVAGTGVFDDTSTSDSNNPPNNRLGRAVGVALGPTGQLFISDGGPSVLSVDTNNPLVPVRAIGTGAVGNSPDGTLASAAQLGNTYSLAYDAPRNVLYLADAGNIRIRKVDLTTQIVTTVAGNGVNGYSGDGGPATSASFRSLYTGALAVDSLGNLYISDNDACVIRLVNPSGLISTLAGNGSCGTPTSGLQANTQSIGLPQGLAVDIAGNVYFSDRFTSNVYRVGLDGILTSLNAGCCAGGDGGPFSAARLFSPQGLYVSPTTGTLYIADQENHRVRAVIGLAPTTGTGRLTLLPLTYTSPVQNTAYLGGTSLPVVGGTGTGRVFSVIGGALPSGITMDSSNGRIVGTPTVSGTFSFTAQVTEPGGRTAVGVYSILVLPPLGTSVAFTVMPNSTTLAGQVFGVVPAVAVGPAVAGVQVSLSLMGGGGAVLSGPTSALTNAAGSATFPGLSIDRAGDGYRLLATLTNGNTGLSNSFNILGAPSSIATAAGTAFINTATGVATSVQLNPEEGLLYDAANNALLISDSRSHRVVSVSLATGALTNKFGTGGPSGFSGDGGQASAAKLNFPLGMTRDSAGNIYLVDGVSRIRRITPAGVISTIAGNGSMGYSGDGGQATAAGMNPTSVAFSSSANALYVADHSNHRVRRIDLATGVISTVAGNGTAGFSGDGSAATAAQLNWPVYVAVDLGGSLIISDHMNSRIRKVTFPDGNIVTIVGSTPCGALGDGGAAALGSLCHPRGIFLDNADNLFIADMSNHRVRKVAGGGITTVAGNGTIDFVPDGGLATANSVYEPRNITLDATGNLYINEGGTNRVRRVNAIINSISTIAGTGSWSFSGDGGGAVSASFRALRGITFDGSGNYYVADSRNFRIRRVTPSGTVSTVAGSGQIGFSGDGGAAVAARFGVDANAVVSTVGGTLYIADYSNDRVRRVSGGSITTFAGGGGSTADNIPATTALISRPRGLALDPNRNLLYISYNDSQIARVDLASGNLSAVSGIAGNNGTGIPGVAATSPVGIPESLAVDPMGNLYVADLANSRIYRITPGGILSILAGNGTRGAGGVGGPALAAQVSNPSGLYADGSGVLYVSDHGNNTVRRIGADAPSTVTAIVNPGFGSTGDGGPASLASVSIPWGLAANPAGDLFIVDDGDTSRVRRIYGAALSSIPVRLTITTTAFNLEVGGVPVPGSSIVQAVGGTGARTWEATGLPPSMSINPSTGAITGTFPSPLGPTTLTFTVTVTDSLGQTTSGLVRQPLTMP